MDEEWIDISGDGGVLKLVTQEGSGDIPPNGSKIRAHYTGTLEDGSKFDSSRDRNKVFKFPLGQGRVIGGWDKGFSSMKVGEKAILRCKPEYAYGENGYLKVIFYHQFICFLFSGHPPLIPSNSTLDFDVELLGFDVKQH